MRNLRNYYRILHVERDAPAAVIKGSYRTLMQTLRHHPDLGGDAWNAQLLNEAMATLGDPVARARYDATLADHPSGSVLRDASIDRERGRESGVRSNAAPPDAGADDVDASRDGRGGRRPDDVGPGDSGDDARRGAPDDGFAGDASSRRDLSPDVASPRRAASVTPAVPLATTAAVRRCPFCDRVWPTPVDAACGGYDAPSACAGCGGPIAPPRLGTEADDASERRRSPRLEHETRATLRRRSRPLDGAEDVTVLELSGSGCMLASATPISSGEIVLLRARTLSAIGVARTCDASASAARRRIALAFLTVELHASAGSFVSRAV